MLILRRKISSMNYIPYFQRGEHTLREAETVCNHERELLVGLSEGRANFLWLRPTAVNSEVEAKSGNCIPGTFRIITTNEKTTNQLNK